MQLLFININYLKIKDVCDILDLKDNRAAKKWLHDNNIKISTLGGKNVVSQFAFEFKRQQIFVEELRKTYPVNWFEIYDANTEDKKMVESIRLLYPKTKSTKKIYNSKTQQFIK